MKEFYNHCTLQLQIGIIQYWLLPLLFNSYLNQSICELLKEIAKKTRRYVQFFVLIILSSTTNVLPVIKKVKHTWKPLNQFPSKTPQNTKKKLQSQFKKI